MRTQWTRYTGCEVFNPHGNGQGIYLSRHANNRFPYFARYALLRSQVAMFFGYTNYLKDVGVWGCEVSIDIRYLPSLRLGIALPERWNPLWWKLNPSVKVRPRRWISYRREPRWGYVAVRVGWFAISFDLSKRLNAWINHRQWKKQEEDMEAFFKAHPEQCSHEEQEI